MYTKILQKKAELSALLKDDPEFRSWIQQSGLWCWLYSVFRIKGQQVSKNTVVTMLSGEIREDVPLSFYAFSQALRDVERDMKSFISMQADLDKKMLNRWAGMLLDKDSSQPSKTLYRLNNPVVHEWDLIPPHFRTIDAQLDDLFKSLGRIKDADDPLAAAARIHLEINRIYPYGEDTVALSMAALLYNMMQLGLPMPELSANDVEYNKMMAEYVFKGRYADFADMLTRSVYNRLDTILGYARQAEELR